MLTSPRTSHWPPGTWRRAPACSTRSACVHGQRLRRSPGDARVDGRAAPGRRVDRQVSSDDAEAGNRTLRKAAEANPWWLEAVLDLYWKKAVVLRMIAAFCSCLLRLAN